MDPAGERRFVQVVWGLAGSEGAPGRLIAIQERVAFVQMDDRSVAAVIWPSLRGSALTERLRELIDLDPRTHLKLVIVGGDASMREILSSIQPRFMTRRMVQVFHLADDGEAWAGRGGRLESPTGRVLSVVGRGEAAPDTDRARIEALAPPAPSPEDRAAVAEHQAFVLQFRARRPRLTWALLVSIAVVFGFEMLFGGSELMPTLVRMGANTDAALTKEPWRLLSHAFLHAGPLHLLVNGWVLFALGGFVERILGWQRTAVLYVLAALAGGVASAAWTEAGLSVGASGAIWGLLGAAGALAFRPAGVLPRNLIKPMRRTALINLVINLSISTLPQVDMMAHLGGGILGALLVGTGVLVKGLPKLDGDRDAPPEHREGRATTTLAVVSLVAAYGALLVALWQGRPWEIARDPQWATQSLGKSGLVVEAPSLLGEAEQVTVPLPPRESPLGPGEEPARETTFVLGDLLKDPIGAVITVRPHGEHLTPQAMESMRQAFVAAQTPVPEPAERVGERRVLADAPRPTFEEDFRFPNGLRMTIRYALWPTADVLTEVLYWENAPEPWVEAALRLASAVSPLE